MQQLSCFCISIEHKKMAKEFTAMQRWNSQITHYKWLERKQEYHKWPNNRPLPNKCPLWAVKIIVLDAPL